MIWRLAGVLVALLLVYAGLQVAWRAAAPAADAKRAVRGSANVAPGPDVSRRGPAAVVARSMTTPVIAQQTPVCASAPSFTAAATRNSASLHDAALSAFGRPEMGWETYAPLVQHEL